MSIPISYSPGRSHMVIKKKGNTSIANTSDWGYEHGDESEISYETATYLADSVCGLTMYLGPEKLMFVLCY